MRYSDKIYDLPFRKFSPNTIDYDLKILELLENIFYYTSIKIDVHGPLL